MEKIKLSDVQKSSLDQVQAQKGQLQKLFQDLNEREKLILELIFDGKAPAGKSISNVKLEGDHLTYEVVAPKAAPKAVEKSAPVAEPATPKVDKVRKLKKA